jgi:hypothetical protein
VTHDEYASRIETWTDEDATAVLEHARSCSACRRDGRLTANALAALLPARRSLAEEAFRIAATAAVVAVVAWALPAKKPLSADRLATARYRIVGTASGVIAYTPDGIVVTGAPGSTERKESSR